MKKYRILSLVLVIIMMFNTVMVIAADEETEQNAYDAGYAMGTEDAKTNDYLPSDNDIKGNYDGKFPIKFLQGYKAGFILAKQTYGERLGTALGGVYGAKDYKDKNSSDWKRHLPLDIDIIKMYDLETETDSYKAKFLLDFKSAFEKAYKEEYEKANLDPVSKSGEAGKRDGTTVGTSLGSIFGEKAYENGKDNIPYMPTDAEIINDYSLERDNEEYQEAFIINFKIAFKLSFEKSYREANLKSKDSEAEKSGYNKGFTDGKRIADDNKAKGILLPMDLVKLTNQQVLARYATDLTGKNDVYKDKFVKGYQEGFRKGYDASNISSAEYLDGYNKGYNDGKALASKNNTDKKFLSYNKVKMTDHEVMGNNYEYLKDKGSEFILNFVRGYQEGFEKGYKEVIKTGKEPEEFDSLSSGYGAAFGTTYGEIAGLQDYERGVSPNWSKAIPRDSELISMFSLRNFQSTERYEFLEQFKKNFKIGYEKAYYAGHFGTIKNSLDAGNTDGSLFGSSLGAIFGAKDYYENRHSDYSRDMPSDSIIRSEYSLNKDNVEYLSGFVNGFKKSYQEAYITSFREAKNNAFIMDESAGFENGSQIGFEKGSMQANIDYMGKKESDWKRSQPMSSTIILEYNLMYQPEKYRDSFISGFWDGYMNGYSLTYKEVSQTANVNKTTSDTIPISGGVLISLDGAFAVTIDKGTYYKPVILTLDALNDNLYGYDSEYISASNFYRVSLVNPSGAYDNNKKIKLSFEYYGDRKGGIYKYENGKWQYMASVMDESSISIMINPSNLKSTGSVYAVLLNKEAPLFHDIRGHWAKDEINTLIRRNVIYGYNDKSFKPENKITRAEFLTLLSRVYNWNLPSYTMNTSQFKDYASFGGRDKIISYAISAGYIKGYEDNTFRPNDTISYKEVETIMARFVDKNFKWHHTAAKMLYEKKIRSSSYDSINNKINRGEVSYLLYILNEWRY